MHATILVSGSHFLKHWQATHSLDVWSTILNSGSDLPEHWRATHILDVWLVSGSDMLKHSTATHILDEFPIHLISKILVNLLLSYPSAL